MQLLGRRQRCLSALHGRWIESRHDGARIQQLPDDFDGGRFANVVGVSFVGQAQGRHPLAPQGPQRGENLVEENLLLGFVDIAYLLKELEIHAPLLRHPVEGGHVLWKTGAAIAQPGAQKPRTDAAVHAHAGGDVFNVGVGGLGQIGHGVDKGDFQGQEGIGGVLDEFGALRRGDQQPGWLGGAADPRNCAGLGVISARGERLVDAPHYIGRALGANARYNAVGMQKVADGRALTEKLRVRHHVEALRGHAMAVEYAADPIVGVDRHRALFHDHLVAVDGAGNLGDHGLHVRQIRGAGVALRRTYGDKNSLAPLHRPAQIGGELDAAIPMPRQQLRQMLFVDGNAAFAQRLHPGFVIVYANHRMAHLGKTNRRHEAYVSGADHTDRNGLCHRLALSPSPLCAGVDGTWNSVPVGLTLGYPLRAGSGKPARRRLACLVDWESGCLSGARRFAATSPKSMQMDMIV